ncbi:hypothetical protein INC97_000577 [Campylobacter upsaliensis]|nr:hypothetical protein [Campylobacter upsaliensis]
MESELKARSFWALARLKGKTWLNAEHLGGCAFRAKKFKAKHGKGVSLWDGVGFSFFASALPRNSSHGVRTLSLEKLL